MHFTRAILVCALVLAACTETKTVYVDRYVDRGVSEFDSAMGRSGNPDFGPVMDGAVIPLDAVSADMEMQAPQDEGVMDQDGALPQDAGLSACDPPLNLGSDQTAARPYDLVRLQANGGSGLWRFDMLDNQSGALVNQSTGAYLAGENVGTTDTLRLSDDGCIGEAEYEIRVVNAMKVRPGGGQVQQGQTFSLIVEEGSGEFTFELLNSRSEGEITEAGQYTAGDRIGVDTIRVTDAQTREFVDVDITVVETVELIPRPAQLFVPVGSSMPMRVEGGTGDFEVSISADGLRFDDGVVHGVTAGSYTLDVVDRFTRHQTSLSVHVVESLQVEITPFDDASLSVRTITPGDLNGDGRSDVIVSYPTGDVLAGNGGAVFVYLSGPDGFPLEPSQVIGGTGRDDDFGRSITTGDVNLDGIPDLIVGARFADPGVFNAGAVYIHLGQGDGQFEEAPWDVLTGQRSSDYLGFSVAVCDLNGDERLDIAAVGTSMEDRNAAQVQSDQGGLAIFINHEDGFLDEPDQVVYGQRFQDGEWSGYRSLNMGTDMVGGDMNGDGLCDLALGANRYAVNGLNNAGAVFIYHGRRPDALSPGGVHPLPARVIVADTTRDNGGGFGRRLHIDDFNGDNLWDLVIGEHGGDTGGRDRGAAYIFLGRENAVDVAEATTSIGVADGQYYGLSNGDNLGIGLTSGDVTGDGIPELIVGAYLDDFPGAGNAGALHVFSGVENGVPDAETRREIAGTLADMRLGEDLTVLDDTNGDGLADIIAHAQRDSSTVLKGGQLYLITRDEAPPPEMDDDMDDAGDDDGEGGGPDQARVDVFTAMDYTRQVAGGRFGTGAALVGDLTGDGLDDAVAVAWGTAGSDTRSGDLWLYRGLPDGGLSPVGESLAGFPNHGSSDLAWSALSAGDFDGDGFNDLALLLRDDERPYYNTMTRPPFSAAEAACRGNQDCTEGRRCRDGRCDGCAADNECPGEQICSDGGCIVPGQCPLRGYNTGGLYIFRGGPEGRFTGQPAFAYFGSFPGLSPEQISAGFDFNGDGFDDIVIGGRRWDNAAGNDSGVVYVITGRTYTAEDDNMQIMCDTYYRLEGTQAGGWLGSSVVGMGDLNGDGCDEFAAGARLEDRTEGGREFRDEGSVRIIYGYGAAGCPPGARMTRLATGDDRGQAGWSLASGDFDQDGLPDLAVGAWQRRTENIPVGGVWVVRGAYLSQMDRKTAAVADADPAELINQWGSQWLIEGEIRDSQLGYALAFSGNYLAVGAPRDAQDERPLTGSVRIFNVDANGVNPEPLAIAIGETTRTESLFGALLNGGTLNGRPHFVVGANQGQGTGLDNGSVFVLPMEQDNE